MRAATQCTVVALAAFKLVVADAANAFDRRADIEQYTRIFSAGSGNEVWQAAIGIQTSGIPDSNLALLIYARLARDLPELVARDASPPSVVISAPPTPRFDKAYSTVMIRALASIGVEESVNLLRSISAQSGGGRSGKNARAIAARELDRVPWYRERNEVMNSKANHVEGENPRASMLINLLLSDSESFRDFAMDCIYRERLRDPRLFDVIERQVLQFLARPRSPQSEPGRLDTYGVKLLGLSGDRSRQDTLKKVLAANVPRTIKRVAGQSLDRLK